VQVLSTSSKAEAVRWKEKLAAKSYRTAAVTAVESKKGKLYRVRTGPYPDRAQAKKAAAKISADFKQQAWVASE
jgi:cell division septation protein DedD